MMYQTHIKRTYMRSRYLGRINQIERKSKLNKKKLKRLENYEAQALQNLKNTTVQHEYVQSRFQHAFGPGLSVSTNLGAQSYRSLHQLEEI